MIIVADFETYYDSDFSLSKLTTEEYIRSPQFEVIGCAISMGGRPPVWYSGSQVEPALRAIDWSQHALLAYHTTFDGSILAWRYGLYPKLYLDAMGMARACGAAYRGASLGKVVETLGVGVKGDEVVRARGKHLHDFTSAELSVYGAYCVNDVNLTMAVYRKLLPDFPKEEIRLQDLMLRMFIEPCLLFDKDVLQEHYDNVVTQQQTALARAAELLGLEPQAGIELNETMRAALASNQKFAALLRELGVEPPTKFSKTTGLEAYAFAKTDEAFVELLEHEDANVQAVVAARLGTKSTIERTRADRFRNIAERGPWPVSYIFCGANTLRFSGGDKANPQNLKRNGRLRDAILPPPGHCLVAGDLSQIECRMLNFLSQQDDVVEAFRQYDAGLGPDVYCIFAGKIFNRVVTTDDKQPRTVGKIAELQLGYGAGAKSYRQMLFTQAGINVRIGEAQNVVDIYRRTHRMVETLWYQAERVLDAMVHRHTFQLGRFPLLHGDEPHNGIGLPNAMFIRYPKLHKRMNKQTGQTDYVYMKGGKDVVIYGSKLVQNCIEALCRIIMTDAWLRISRHYKVVLTCHDELVIIAPIMEAEAAARFLKTELTRPIPWAPDLPIACTVGWGDSYGACKS